MPSPFPGMNPYIEQDAFWHDFHSAFLPVIRGRLVSQVRPNYIVLIEEHIYVHELLDALRRLVGRSDVSVAERARPGHGGEERGGVAVDVLEAPSEVLLVAEDIERVPFLEVRDRHNRDLIAVVELLSPSNKRNGPDRDQYVAKRNRRLASDAHFVEIDLLRGGRPMSLEHRERQVKYRSPARARVREASRRGRHRLGWRASTGPPSIRRPQLRRSPWRDSPGRAPATTAPMHPLAAEDAA
ncbi:MAG: DUF4058 family protein [Isosphaeraceae bacterium]